MSEVAPLISDLAIILIIAGIVTVIFKWLKQPVILGYIVAGIMAGPSVSLVPTVSDPANIKIWADIGVIFLLFAMGLDFSFKKIDKCGHYGYRCHCHYCMWHDVHRLYSGECNGVLPHEQYFSGWNVVHVVHGHRIQGLQ